MVSLYWQDSITASLVAGKGDAAMLIPAQASVFFSGLPILQTDEDGLNPPAKSGDGEVSQMLHI